MLCQPLSYGLANYMNKLFLQKWFKNHNANIARNSTVLYAKKIVKVFVRIIRIPCHTFYYTAEEIEVSCLIYHPGPQGMQLLWNPYPITKFQTTHLLKSLGKRKFENNNHVSNVWALISWKGHEHALNIFKFLCRHSTNLFEHF